MLRQPNTPLTAFNLDTSNNEPGFRLPGADGVPLSEHLTPTTINDNEPGLRLLNTLNTVNLNFDDNEPGLQLPRADGAPLSERPTPTTEEALPQSHFPYGIPIFSQPSTSASAQAQGGASASIPTTL